MYRAVGTELPGSVVKSFEDIADFHQSVADNRRFHLSSQLDAIRRRISAVTVEMNTARARRDEILRDLKGKGAFSDLAAMQKVAAEKSENMLGFRPNTKRLLRSRRAAQQGKSRRATF